MNKKNTGFTLIELMIVVAIISILTAIAIPQYQIYIVKTQVTRAMGEAGALKTSIDTCMLVGLDNNCKSVATGSSILEGDSQDTNYLLPAGTGVPQMSLSLTVPCTVIAKFGYGAANIIKGKFLTWSRNTVSGSWTCTTNVEERFKPKGCNA